jgi:hypothetical protein
MSSLPDTSSLVPQKRQSHNFSGLFRERISFGELGCAYPKSSRSSGSKRRRTGFNPLGRDAWAIPRDDSRRLDCRTLPKSTRDLFNCLLPGYCHLSDGRQHESAGAGARSRPVRIFKRLDGRIHEQPGRCVRTAHGARGDVFLSCPF